MIETPETHANAFNFTVKSPGKKIFKRKSFD